MLRFGNMRKATRMFLNPGERPLGKRQWAATELPHGVGKTAGGLDCFFNARGEPFLLRDAEGRLSWVSPGEKVAFVPSYFFYDIATNPPWKDALIKRMLKLLLQGLWSHRMA